MKATLPASALNGRALRPRCRTLVCRATAAGPEKLRTKLCIVGSGPAAHTAAIYAGRAELKPLLFEGFMANGIAAGGQLTTTTYIENFPGFVEPILGLDLTDNFRKQSLRHGATIITETIKRVDFSSRPYKLFSDSKEVIADTVILATGASARRLNFPGADEKTGYWNKGISACAICDGTSPLIRNHPVAVIGGGDTAMEEAVFLCRYASKVYIIHRFDYFEASKVMQRKVFVNPKIQVLWQHEAVEAYGNDKGELGGLKVINRVTQEVTDLQVNGLFFAIGHVPATKFLAGQIELDSYGYIKTKPGTTHTSVPGVFAAGDVQDPVYKQAIVSAGFGCMAALDAERYLQHMTTVATSADSNNIVQGLVTSQKLAV